MNERKWKVEMPKLQATGTHVLYVSSIQRVNVFPHWRSKRMMRTAPSPVSQEILIRIVMCK